MERRPHVFDYYAYLSRLDRNGMYNKTEIKERPKSYNMSVNMSVVKRTIGEHIFRRYKSDFAYRYHGFQFWKFMFNTCKKLFYHDFLSNHVFSQEVDAINLIRQFLTVIGHNLDKRILVFDLEAFKKNLDYAFSKNKIFNNPIAPEDIDKILYEVANEVSSMNIPIVDKISLLFSKTIYRIRKQLSSGQNIDLMSFTGDFDNTPKIYSVRLISDGMVDINPVNDESSHVKFIYDISTGLSTNLNYAIRHIKNNKVYPLKDFVSFNDFAITPFILFNKLVEEVESDDKLNRKLIGKDEKLYAQINIHDAFKPERLLFLYGDYIPEQSSSNENINNSALENEKRFAGRHFNPHVFEALYDTNIYTFGDMDELKIHFIKDKEFTKFANRILEASKRVFSFSIAAAHDLIYDAKKNLPPSGRTIVFIGMGGMNSLIYYMLYQFVSYYALTFSRYPGNGHINMYEFRKMVLERVLGVKRIVIFEPDELDFTNLLRMPMEHFYGQTNASDVVDIESKTDFVSRMPRIARYTTILKDKFDIENIKDFNLEHTIFIGAVSPEFRDELGEALGDKFIFVGHHDNGFIITNNHEKYKIDDSITSLVRETYGTIDPRILLENARLITLLLLEHIIQSFKNNGKHIVDFSLDDWQKMMDIKLAYMDFKPEPENTVKSSIAPIIPDGNYMKEFFTKLHAFYTDNFNKRDSYKIMEMNLYLSNMFMDFPIVFRSFKFMMMVDRMSKGIPTNMTKLEMARVAFFGQYLYII